MLLFSHTATATNSVQLSCEEQIGYREHLDDTKRNTQTKNSHKHRKLFWKKSKVICVNTPSSSVWPDSLRARCVLLYHFG